MIVGKIIKPQGIKGELKLAPLVSNAEDFKNFENVVIDGKSYKTKSVRVHEGFVFLWLDKVNDRNFAETLRGKMVEVEKSQLPKLDENHFFVVELIDCEIFFEDGEKLGKVFDVQNFGASDILHIKCGTEEVFCPFLKKIFYEIDTQNKKIVANRKNFLEATSEN